MRAMAAPVLGHLDPALLDLMDDIRASLGRVFRAPEGSLALAVSGTGTSGMEAAVANLVAPGTRVVSVVNGYFGARLADMAARYGGDVRRVEGEWGRAIDPGAVRRALEEGGADVVAAVHAETSTGVREPGARRLPRQRRAHDALVLVDAVTSLGGMPLDVSAWDVDACYSGSQKCLGAPSGLAPIVFTPRALARRVPCRSFYLDLALLQDYWVGRKYHHTIAATLVYALREALLVVEEEGLEARWARHERHHRVLTSGLEAMGLPLYPPAGERLWTLHTVRVPDGRRRGRRAPRSARGLQHRDRRRHGAARRQGLARGPDGCRLGAGVDSRAARRAGAHPPADGTSGCAWRGDRRGARCVDR